MNLVGQSARLAADYVASRFSRPARFDGRILLIAALSICLGAAGLGASKGVSLRIWQLFGVPAISPSFWDLRCVTAGWDRVRQGVNPLYYVPTDPAKVDSNHPQLWNYPRLWLLPGKLGLTERHTVTLGLLIAGTFYLSVFVVFGKLAPPEGMVCAIMVCSPAVLLAVERGNTDLVIFTLMTLTYLTLPVSRGIAYGVIVLAAMLKLYPIFALLAAIREKRRIALIIVACCSVLFLGYLLITLSDIRQISKVTPRPTFWGFGCMTLASKLNDSLRFRNYDIGAVPNAIGLLIGVAASLAACLSGLKIRCPSADQSRELDAFRIGALVYAGSFLIGNNFHYRLIFLLFCAPQLLAWIKNKREWRQPASMSLLCIIVIMWMPWFLVNAWQLRHAVFPITEVTSWTLLVLLLRFVAATFPEAAQKRKPSSAS